MKRILTLLLVLLCLSSFFVGCSDADIQIVSSNENDVEDVSSYAEQNDNSLNVSVLDDASSKQDKAEQNASSNNDSSDAVSSNAASSNASSANNASVNASSNAASSSTTSSKPVSSNTNSSVSSNTSSENNSEPISLSDLKELSKSEYYCYNKLTNVQKNVYDAVYEMVRDYKSGDKMISGASAKDISIAYNAVHLDNPQFFWMGSAYYVLTETNGDKVTYGIRLNPDGKGYITKSLADKNEKQQKLNNLVNSVILSVIKKDMTKAEMAKAVHDYICEKTSYNYNHSIEKDKYNWTSYGALIENTAVCEGYSRAFQLILYKLGIKNTIISGTANGGDHAWNAVYLGGWKTIDVTWDDKKDGTYDHKYYGITSINPSSNHKAFALLKKASNDDINIGKYNFFDELK